MNSIIKFKKFDDDCANDLAYEMYSKKENIVLQSTGGRKIGLLSFLADMVFTTLIHMMRLKKRFA